MHRTSLSLSALALMLALPMHACATRAVPAHIPAASPASPEAKAPRPSKVTVALDADPPLPGETAKGWPGLDAPAEPRSDHAHHHQHGARRDAEGGRP